jgi:hypothetical protein
MAIALASWPSLGQIPGSDRCDLSSGFPRGRQSYAEVLADAGAIVQVGDGAGVVGRLAVADARLGCLGRVEVAAVLGGELIETPAGTRRGCCIKLTLVVSLIICQTARNRRSDLSEM